MIFFGSPENWILFLLIPVYILLIGITFYYYRRKLKNLFGVDLLFKLIRGRGLFRILLKKTFLVISLAFLILSLTDPRWGDNEKKTNQISSDLVLLIDVSSSMLVEDIQPNRLEKVKLKISEMINLQKGNRIGITVFAGSSFVYTPLTTDYNSLRTFVRNLSTSIVSRQGTDLSLGLKTSLKAFMDNAAQKILVVFTDGENHNQDYQEVVEEFVEKNITVFMIGVGSPNGEKIPLRDEQGKITEYLRDNFGRFVISKLDYNTLSDITQKTGGVYFPLTAKQDDILAINEYINQNQLQERKVEKTLKSRYQIFALLAFFFLITEIFIGTQKKTNTSKS